MHHDPDRSWITDPDLDHPKGTHPKKVQQTRKLRLQTKTNGIRIFFEQFLCGLVMAHRSLMFNDTKCPLKKLSFWQPNLS